MMVNMLQVTGQNPYSLVFLLCVVQQQPADQDAENVLKKPRKPSALKPNGPHQHAQHPSPETSLQTSPELVRETLIHLHSVLQR